MRDFSVNVIEKRKKIWLNYLEQYAKNQETSQSEAANGGDFQLADKASGYERIGGPAEAGDAKVDKQISDEEKFQNFFTGTKTRLAFLDLLLQQHFKDPNNFTTEDVREETDTFMFAVSSVFQIFLGLILNLLILNPFEVFQLIFVSFFSLSTLPTNRGNCHFVNVDVFQT